jgi:hypothetical protein
MSAALFVHHWLSIICSVLVEQVVQRLAAGTLVTFPVAGVQVLGGGVDAVVSRIGLYVG